MTGTLVFYSEFDDFDQWKRLLQREIPSSMCSMPMQ